MAPEIIGLTVDSPPSSRPTHPRRPNSTSSSAASSSSSSSSATAADTPKHQPRRRPESRPRPSNEYKHFIRNERGKQQRLIETAPTTAGPSRLHYYYNINGSSATQNMQQGGQALPVLDAWWTERDHDLFVEGLSKCGLGNWTGMAEFVKTKTPQQICDYSAEYFSRVRFIATRATRYIEKRSPATAAGSVNMMDMMVYAAPLAKNYASRQLRRLSSKGLEGLQKPRPKNMVHEPSGGQGLLRAPMVSAPGQHLGPVSAPNAVPIPVVSPPTAVPIPASGMKSPQMVQVFPAEGVVPLLLTSGEGGSSTSSFVSGDHWDGEAEDKNDLDLELTLGWRSQ